MIVDVISKGAIEHAKDVAQEAVQQARDAAQEAVQTVQEKAGKQPKKRRMSRAWLLLGIVGAVVIVAMVVRRRAAGRSVQPAPDAFGAAVEQERAAQSYGRPNVATPGA